jgi:hypothetical protein
MWKTKFFTRLMREVSQGFYFTSSLHAGVMIDKDQARKRVNDSFYLQNFKGIKNLGYHYDAKDKTGGDILGFDKYASLQLKLSQQDCPLLSSRSLHPFIFANLALAPNRSMPAGFSSFLRHAYGVGLTLRTDYITLECYYNIYLSG